MRTIHAFSGIAGLRVDFVMRKIAFDGLNGVLRRSPVDTGRFRASWRVGLNKYDNTVEPVKPKGTQAAQKKGASPSGNEVREAHAEIKKVKRDDTIRITNSLPYAVRLENGYSPQAPNGVVSPTFLEIRLGIAKATREARRAVSDA